MSDHADLLAILCNRIKWIGVLVDIFREYVLKHPSGLRDGRGKKFLLIKPGEFSRGDGKAPEELKKLYPDLKDSWVGDSPNVRVEITQSFYMAVHPVTVAEFRKFVEATKYVTTAERGKPARFYNRQEEEDSNLEHLWPIRAHYKGRPLTWQFPGFEQHETEPVVCISWIDAMAYVDWLNDHAKRFLKGRGKKFRFALPTEAQWEYACRGGTTTEFFWGDKPNGGNGNLNAADLNGTPYSTEWKYHFEFDDTIRFTCTVDKCGKNRFKLLNMLGNVWEWCLDHYDAGYYMDPATPTQDPPGPVEESLGDYPNRVMRGGSWTSPPGKCRCAYRGHADKDVARVDTGFRLVIVRK